MQLQILNQDFWDENQKAVLASDLYSELSWDFSNYWRWAKASIIEDKYSIQHKDWISSSHGDLTEQDYILSLEFAKVLAMQSRTKKWNEVRRYFIEIEKEYIKQLQQNKIESFEHFSLQMDKWLEINNDSFWESLKNIKKKFLIKANIDNLVNDWLENNDNIIQWPLYKESPKNLYSSFITFTKSTISKPVLYNKFELLWFKRIEVDWYEYFKWIKLWQ